MGVFRRKDSPFWWLYLETTKRRERTAILVGETMTQRRDSKLLAQQIYHQRMNDLGARRHRLPVKPEARQFASYAKAYDETVIAHRKGVTREREMLKHLRAFFDDSPLEAIDRELVQEYQTARLGDRPTPSKNTVNREVDLLKGMLRDAVPKYLTTSPIAGMPRMKCATQPKRILSIEEEQRLLDVSTDPQDYAILVLGIDTLVRMGDLLALRRVDRQGFWLLIRDPKTRMPYHVPLSPRAVKALDAISENGPHYFAKFRRAENPRDWTGSVRQRLEYLCRLANVPYGYLKGVTFHGATRKTGATRLLIRDKVDLASVQRIGGWKQPETLLRVYAEVSRDDLLKAVGQVKETD